MADNPHVAAARTSLAVYMGLVHETDMPHVFGGRAAPPEHLFPLVKRLSQVAQIILQKPGWEGWLRTPLRHTSVVLPPGWAKTTLIQSFYEWLVGRASEEWGKGWADRMHIAHISNSADQARRVSFAVRSTVAESDIYHAIFPKVEPVLPALPNARSRLLASPTISTTSFRAIYLRLRALRSRFFCSWSSW